MDTGVGDSERQIRNLPGMVKKVVGGREGRGGAIPWDQQCLDNPSENHFLPAFRSFALRLLRFSRCSGSCSQVPRSPAAATGTSWGGREGCDPHRSFPLTRGSEEMKHLSFGELKRTIRLWPCLCQLPRAPSSAQAGTASGRSTWRRERGAAVTGTSPAHLGGILL